MTGPDDGTAAVHMVAHASSGSRILQAGGNLTVRISLAGPTPESKLISIVKNAYQRQITAMRLHNPRPLPVTWTTVQPPFGQSWSTVRRDGLNEFLRLSGDIDDLPDLVLDSRHRGRILILGEAGCGKTGSAVDLAYQLAVRWLPGDPVPLLLRLSTWNPTMQPLDSWIHERLWFDYGLPDARPTRRQSNPPANGDVRAVRILPILDGLDEINGVTHRQLAIDSINNTLGRDTPLIVTARSAQYHELNSSFRSAGLIGTIAIVLEPLSRDAIATYLSESSSLPWATALQQVNGLRSPLPGLLAVPLWIALARTTDPEGLLYLASPAEVQQHLLDGLVPHAYPAIPVDSSSVGRSWPRASVNRWLAYMAKTMVRRHTHDIAWWEFADILPIELRRRWTSFVFGFIIATCLLALSWRWEDWSQVGGIPGRLLMFAICLIGAARTDDTAVFPTPRPSHLHPLPRRRTDTPTRIRLVVAASVGAPVGAIFAFAFANVVAKAQELAASVHAVPAVAVGGAGAACGILVAVLAEFFTVFGHDAELDAPVDILLMIRRDRTRAMGTIAVAAVFVGAVTVPLLGWLGVLLAVCCATGYGLLSCSWGWYFLARTWLALTGRLPWRLTAFLADAHGRGVLRQSGTVYQFRHSILRDRLAGVPMEHADVTSVHHSSDYRLSEADKGELWTRLGSPDLLPLNWSAQTADTSVPLPRGATSVRIIADTIRGLTHDPGDGNTGWRRIKRRVKLVAVTAIIVSLCCLVGGLVVGVLSGTVGVMGDDLASAPAILPPFSGTLTANLQPSSNRVIVRGTGFGRSEPVEIDLATDFAMTDIQTAGYARTNAEGTFNATIVVTLPSANEQQFYYIVATGQVSMTVAAGQLSLTSTTSPTVARS